MEQPPPLLEDPHAVQVHPNPPHRLRTFLRTCFLVLLGVWYAQYYTNGPVYRLLASTAPWTPNSIFSNPHQKGTVRNPHTRAVVTTIGGGGGGGTASHTRVTLAQSFVRSTRSWTSTEMRLSTAMHAYGPRHTHTVEYRYSAVVVSTEVSEVAWTDVTPPHGRGAAAQGAELQDGVPMNTCRNILRISPPDDDLCLPP